MSESKSLPAGTRRRFLKQAGSLLAVPGFASMSTAVWAAPTPSSSAESAVARFYATLTEAQRKQIVLPFDHELRRKIHANWHVTEPTLGDDFYTEAQRKLVDEIVRGVTSPEGYERVILQTRDDDGGLEGYSVALFGTPESGRFEWELTGRHLTLRADGNSVDKVAFGGPLVYGHGATDPAKNLFHGQTKQVNEVFRALDPARASRALVEKAPAEAEVGVQGSTGRFAGIPLTALSSDQKTLVENTLKSLLSLYRKEDVDEVFDILGKSGGIDALHLAFYQQGDLNEDREWDIWRVEGPSLVWHFRGAPHVHAYLNVQTA